MSNVPVKINRYIKFLFNNKLENVICHPSILLELIERVMKKISLFDD